MGTWASLVPRGFGTCCLGGQKSPPGRPALPLSMRVMPSYFCYPWDRCPEEGTAPIARPLPPRQTTGLGPGDQPSAERELEPGSNSWPHSSVPGGHRLLPRPPSQPVPRLHPTPQNTLLGTWLGEAVKGPPAGKSPTPSPPGCRTSPSGCGGAQHGPHPTGPLPHSTACVHGLGLPAGIHALQMTGRLQGNLTSQRGP